MQETWKPIKGYEGLYEISNLGRVKSLKRVIVNSGAKGGFITVKEKILTSQKNARRNGYYEISLHKVGEEKRYKIHRLVASAFLANPDNKPEVNHIDGDKANNCVSNLEWVTSKENKEHAWKNGLQNSNHKKKPIKCNETGECFESVAHASIVLDCDRRQIFRVLKGEKKMAKKKTFSYITQQELKEYRKGRV